MDTPKWLLGVFGTKPALTGIFSFLQFLAFLAHKKWKCWSLDTSKWLLEAFGTTTKIVLQFWPTKNANVFIRHFQITLGDIWDNNKLWGFFDSFYSQKLAILVIQMVFGTNIFFFLQFWPTKKCKFWLLDSSKWLWGTFERRKKKVSFFFRCF